MDVSSLPPGQARVFAAVLGYWAAHGHSPTVRDLMLDLRLTSPNGIAHHLKALERKGFLTREATTARGIMPAGLLPAIQAAVARYARRAGVVLPEPPEGDARAEHP